MQLLNQLCTASLFLIELARFSINTTLITIQLALFQADLLHEQDQGYLLPAGNAWTDAGFDNEGAIDFWWTHALISDEVRDSLLQSCNFNGVAPLQQRPLTPGSLEHDSKAEVRLGQLVKSCNSCSVLGAGLLVIAVWQCMLQGQVSLCKHGEGNNGSAS